MKYHTEVFESHCSTPSCSIVFKHQCSIRIQACLQEVYSTSLIAAEDVGTHEDKRETKSEKCTLVGGLVFFENTVCVCVCVCVCMCVCVCVLCVCACGCGCEGANIAPYSKAN